MNSFDPFDPFDVGDNRDRPDEPIEAALRDSLAANARRGPDPDAVTERILAAAGGAGTDQFQPRDRGPRGPWRTWGLPLVAAASVAAIVGGVVALSRYHPGSDQQAAATNSPSASAAPSPSSPASPTPSAPTKGHVVNPPVSNTSPPSAATSTPTDTTTLHGVKVVDLTFTGPDTGFALESADCISGTGRCAALQTTTNGTTWTSYPSGPFDVPGISAGCPMSRCVEHIRFASSTIGYAYGPDALFMTTDGAKTWTHLIGGAEALETLDNNVIRIVLDDGNCQQSCVQAETAGLGSSTWTTVQLGGRNFFTDGVELARSGSDAYVLAELNPAGGGDDERSTLFRSTDDGSTWTEGAEPCPQTAGAEVDSRQIAAAPNGRASVLCLQRNHPDRQFVATSSDTGAAFARMGGKIPASVGANLLTGDPDTVLIVAGYGLARSTDGGSTWHHVSSVTGDVSFVGFESTTVARAVTDGNTIWTTYDAGQSWTSTTLG